MAEKRELDALDIDQPKEPTRTLPRGPRTGNYIHGTDFRHAVEFSKSGRARTSAYWAFVRGGVPTVHRAPQRLDLGVLPAVSRACGPVRSRSVQGEQYTTLEAPAGGPRRPPWPIGNRSPDTGAVHGTIGPRRSVGTLAARPRGPERSEDDPALRGQAPHARRYRWHTAVPSVRRHRGAGTGRSPGGPPVGRSWGCSAPTCAGMTRP